MKRILHVKDDGGVEIEVPSVGRGEHEAVAVDRAWRRLPPEKRGRIIDESDLPSDKTHRDAWIWNGERVVVDPSRIRPRQPRQQASAAPVQEADIGPLRQELAERMQAERFQGVVDELRREFNAKQEETLQEAERRFRLGLEAIAVVGRVQSNEPVDLDAVPALVNEVKASGVPVTEEAVIAAADRHAARIHQIAAGRA